MSGFEDGSWTGPELPSRRNTSRAEGRSAGCRRSRSTHKALRSSGTPGASSHGAGGSNRCLSINTAMASAQEWQPAREGLEEHHAHAVPVAGRRDGQAGRLLGRHVGGRAEDVLLGALVPAIAPLLGHQAEIEEHDPTLASDDHVRRLDVAVQLPRRVEPRDPVGELASRRA